ncbi:MAG: efflux RND transporter periplasmic adaptor subunit [Cellulosilyticaceae bacterium]
MKGKISKKIVIGGIIVVLVGVFSISALTKPKTKSTDEIVGDKQNQMVQVEKSKVKDIQTKISSSGVLESDKSEKVYAETATKVLTVNKKLGDIVKKGDILINLDVETKDKLKKDMEKLDLQIQNTNIQLEQLMGEGSKQEILQAKSATAELEKVMQDTKERLRAAKESLKTQETDLKEAKHKLELEEQLFAEEISSQNEVDNKKKEVNSLNEKITTTKQQIASIEKEIKNTELKQDSAEYSLGIALNTIEDKNKVQSISIKQNEIKSLVLQKESLQDELDKSKNTIVAPIDGVISSVTVQEGSFTAPGAELMTIIDVNNLIVKTDVSPYYASQLAKDLKAIIKYNGSKNIEAEGKVRSVAPTAVTKAGAGKNEATSTVIPVEIELAAKTQELKPGLVVDVRIITQDIKNAVTVPLLATMEDKEGESYIFVVKEDNTLEKRVIQQGAADSLAIEIKNIKEGELVVTNPTETLQDGMAVSYMKLKDSTENKAGESK